MYENTTQTQTNAPTEDPGEILKYLVDSGKIDLGSAEEEMRQSKITEIIKAHPYKIYQGKDGKWYTHIPDDSKSEKRRKIVRATLEEIHEVLYDHYSGAEERRLMLGKTIETLYPQWLEYKKLITPAPTTITRLQIEWRKYYEGTPIVKVPIIKLKKLDLDKWAHSLIRERELTSKQFSNLRAIMNQVLDYAVDLEIIKDNPFDKVKIRGKHLFRPVKKKDPETQVYSVEEEKTVKEMAWKDYEDRVKRYVLSPLAVLLQLETGVRIGELCVLRYEDVHGDYLKVQRMYRRDDKEVVPYTKGAYGDRDVILTSEAKRIIETCRKHQQELGVEDDGYIFSINGNPCSYWAIRDLYTKYSRKLGLSKNKPSHTSRRTTLTKLLDGHMHLDSVREMAGHCDERTTLSNYYYDRSTDAEKVRQVEAALAN